jgi:hypothetical protein
MKQNSADITADCRSALVSVVTGFDVARLSMMSIRTRLTQGDPTVAQAARLAN